MMYVSNNLVDLFVNQLYFFLGNFGKFSKEEGMLMKCTYGIGFGIRDTMMYTCIELNVLS